MFHCISFYFILFQALTFINKGIYSFPGKNNCSIKQQLNFFYKKREMKIIIHTLTYI